MEEPDPDPGVKNRWKFSKNVPKTWLFYLLPDSVSGLVQRLTCFQDPDLVYNVCGSTSLVSIMWGRNKTNYLFYPCTGYIFISFFVIENQCRHFFGRLRVLEVWGPGTDSGSYQIGSAPAPGNKIGLFELLTIWLLIQVFFGSYSPL